MEKLIISWVTGFTNYTSMSPSCPLELIAREPGSWRAILSSLYGEVWDDYQSYPPSQKEVNDFIEAVKGEFPDVEIEVGFTPAD